MTTPKDQLQQWFQYLQDFQIACEGVDTDTVYQNLLDFANDKISTCLATADEQGKFIDVAQQSTKLIITTVDLSASSTFEALLETTWNPLNYYVASFTRSCAAPPFGSMGFTDFLQQKLAKVFPGGATDSNWTRLHNGLISSIPAACYSTNQQKAVIGLLSTKIVQDLVNLLSKMG